MNDLPLVNMDEQKFFDAFNKVAVGIGEADDADDAKTLSEALQAMARAYLHMTDAKVTSREDST